MSEINQSEIKLKATLENFDKLIEFITSKLTSANVNNTDKNKILTASEEIIVNVLKYAYCGNIGEIEIILKSGSGNVELTIIDSGTAFNPLEKPDVDINVSLEAREIGGLGIFITKKLMDEVKYEYTENQNRLTIIKDLNQ